MKSFIPDITNCITDGHFDPLKVQIAKMRELLEDMKAHNARIAENLPPVKAIPLVVRKVVKLYTE